MFLIGKMQNKKSYYLELVSKSTFYYVFGVFIPWE